MARPTIYTGEIALGICKRIANGESLRSVCLDKEIPNRDTIHTWILDETKQITYTDESTQETKIVKFSDQYKFACDIRAENMADELQEIADDKEGDVQRDRLRVDTRKWVISKILPKKYGDKVDVTSGGEKIKGNAVVYTDFKENGTDS